MVMIQERHGRLEAGNQWLCRRLSYINVIVTGVGSTNGDLEVLDADTVPLGSLGNGHCVVGKFGIRTLCH